MRVPPLATAFSINKVSARSRECVPAPAPETRLGGGLSSPCPKKFPLLRRRILTLQKTCLTLQADCAHSSIPDAPLPFKKALVRLTTVTGDPKEKQKNPFQEAWEPRGLAGPQETSRRSSTGLGAWGGRAGAPGCFRPTFLRAPQARNRALALPGTPGTPVLPRGCVWCSAQSPLRPPGGAESRGAGGKPAQRPAWSSGLPARRWQSCCAGLGRALLLAPSSRSAAAAALGLDLSPGAEQGGWRAVERDGAIKA